MGLSQEGRRELLLGLARDYDVNRARVCELMRQYLSVELPHSVGSNGVLCFLHVLLVLKNF